MNKKEIISLIKRSKFSKSKAIVLIADFLGISKNHAIVFYEMEILNKKEVEQ